jgi:hypothetical protein
MGVPVGKRLGGFVGGAASGAATGSIFGAPGAIIGGVLGGTAGLFSKSDSELAEEARARRRDNYDTFKRSIESRRAKSLTEGSQKIGRLTSGLQSRFRGSAQRRATAMGRVSDVEAFELPVVSEVANRGTANMADFITDTNRSYDQQSLAAEQAFLESENQYASDMQSQPGVIDYLGEIAPIALNYTMNRDFLDRGYGQPIAPPAQEQMPPIVYPTPTQYNAPAAVEDGPDGLRYNYVTGEWE